MVWTVDSLKFWVAAALDALRNASFCAHFNEMCPRCAVEHSHAQFFEDRVLYRTLQIATHLRSGTFVEIGAFDGVNLSNTYMLERCYDWRGLLIEANPENFRRLRTLSGRSAAMVHSAVCERRGTVQLGGAGETSVQSGVARSAWATKNFPSNLTSNEVPCEPLGDLMRTHGVHRATLLSLDVEGAEDLVLATVDPRRFRVILVEWSQSVEEAVAARLARVEKLMADAGMVLHQTLSVGVAEHGGLSRVYLHPELAGHPLLLPYYRKARPRHVRNCTARAAERLELARANPERGFPEFERACFV